MGPVVLHDHVNSQVDMLISSPIISLRHDRGLLQLAH
jgi:hypothetical protein